MSSPSAGRSSAPCISSATRLICAPSLPPGWNTWNWSAPKPRASITATASASPRASVSVVEVVGAMPMAQTSGILGRVSR